MSGIKIFDITAGISGEIGLLDGIASALAAYRERRERERLAAIKREQDIKQRIAQIRSRINSGEVKPVVATKLRQVNSQSDNTHTNSLVSGEVKSLTNTENNPSTQKEQGFEDIQIQVNKLLKQLPTIRLEYQTLVEQQLLDAISFEQTFEKAEIALQNNQLTEAQRYLQQLDDARIHAMEKVKSEMTEQLAFIQSRVKNLEFRLPKKISQQLQTKISNMHDICHDLRDADITVIHQEISSYESQINQIQTAAENLVAAWRQVGYVAEVSTIDDGDVIVEIETHEGANTQMRIQFDGQQMDLVGPHDEQDNSSCGSRTFEVIRLFEQQGYQLEWSQWNGQPVNLQQQGLIEGVSSHTNTIYHPQNTQDISCRTSESQGY